MANNITAGLNFVTASTTASWATVGLTQANTLEIYKSVNGNPVSWKPGRLINTLGDTGIIEGQGYLLNSMIARDLTTFFGPGGDNAVLLSSLITQVP